MNKIAFIFITLLSLPACSSCLIKGGVYSNFGGSEYSTRLELLDNGIFTQQYEQWNPANKGENEKTTARGRWTCRDNRIEFEVGNKVYYSVIIRVGENPLAIDEDVKVLHFEEGGFEYLSREILYPILVLNNK